MSKYYFFGFIVLTCAFVRKMGGALALGLLQIQTSLDLKRGDNIAFTVGAVHSLFNYGAE